MATTKTMGVLGSCECWNKMYLLLHFGLVVSITLPDMIWNLLPCQIVSTDAVQGQQI